MPARRNILVEDFGDEASLCFRQNRNREGGGGRGRERGRVSNSPEVTRNTQHATRTASAFTLMELILVMTVLAIAVSITAPALSSFFRGRTLDSEARRMVSLGRHGQSRAVAEGVPMELWLDSATQTYGLEAEPSFEPTDSKAVNIQMDSDMQLQVVSPPAEQNPTSLNSAVSPAPAPKSNHSNLPRIRFLTDGSIAQSSPQMIQLTGRDGSSRWIVLSRNHLGYEIRAQK